VRIERHVLGSQDLMERKRFGYRKGSRGFAMLLSRKVRGLRYVVSKKSEGLRFRPIRMFVLKLEAMRAG
jgi:hypothetical protein